MKTNNMPSIDKFHPDYWFYRQEEMPYDEDDLIITEDEPNHTDINNPLNK